MLFLQLSLLLPAQQDAICIDTIEIIGAYKTDRAYILRELSLAQEDCLPAYNLDHVLYINTSRLMNTGLFFDVRISGRSDREGQVWLTVFLKESARISFNPYVHFADRNFNVWWVQKKHLLDRLNFTLKTRLANMNGFNDQLYVVGQLGYTQKVELIYYSPVIATRDKLGFSVQGLWSRQKEINYATVSNAQAFHIHEQQYLLQRGRVKASLHYRPRYYWRHEWDVEWHAGKIRDFVTDSLNPRYFLHGKDQQYDAYVYNLFFDSRDRIPYPEQGLYMHFRIWKEGLFRRKDLDGSFLSAEIRHYQGLAAAWSSEHIVKGRVGLQRNERPYYNNRALGFETDFVRGYENFLIDGLDYFYTKHSLRWRIWNRRHQLGRWLPFPAFRTLPLQVYLTANADAGYVNNRLGSTDNNFANIFLVGGGFGIDFVAYYDKVIRLEASMNHILKGGVYLHYKFGIQ